MGSRYRARYPKKQVSLHVSSSEELVNGARTYFTKNMRLVKKIHQQIARRMTEKQKHIFIMRLGWLYSAKQNELYHVQKIFKQIYQNSKRNIRDLLEFQRNKLGAKLLHHEEAVKAIESGNTSESFWIYRQQIYPFLPLKKLNKYNFYNSSNKSSSKSAINKSFSKMLNMFIRPPYMLSMLITPSTDILGDEEVVTLKNEIVSIEKKLIDHDTKKQEFLELESRLNSELERLTQLGYIYMTKKKKN